MAWVRPGSVCNHRVGPLAYQAASVYTTDRILTSSQCLYMKEARLKTAQVNLRLMPELKKAAEKAAADDQRTLTSLVEKLLTEHLRKTGYLRK